MSDDATTAQPPQVTITRNGLLRDVASGKFLPGRKPDNMITTSEQARELAARRHQKKRDTIQAAANDAVERGDYRQRYGDLAFVAALAETAMLKATTADDPKAIEAARFLLRETGLAEADATDTTAGAAAGGVLAQLGAEAVRYLLDRAQAQRAQDVDE
jgi:hypothetical protein